MKNIITTSSGLRYETLKEGKKDRAKRGSLVSVHYTGWLNKDDTKDKEFDSSHKRNEPFTFPLGAGYVIKGWDEGVEGMEIGEVRRLFIPSNLGYGNQEVGNLIPANSDLIFDVELISVD
jgi:FKBP-type peptidyl-prolyl cis-trans isomerase FkpA